MRAHRKEEVRPELPRVAWVESPASGAEPPEGPPGPLLYPERRCRMPGAVPAVAAGNGGEGESWPAAPA